MNLRRRTTVLLRRVAKSLLDRAQVGLEEQERPQSQELGDALFTLLNGSIFLWSRPSPSLTRRFGCSHFHFHPFGIVLI